MVSQTQSTAKMSSIVLQSWQVVVLECLYCQGIRRANSHLVAKAYQLTGITIIKT